MCQDASVTDAQLTLNIRHIGRGGGTISKAGRHANPSVPIPPCNQWRLSWVHSKEKSLSGSRYSLSTCYQNLI